MCRFLFLVRFVFVFLCFVCVGSCPIHTQIAFADLTAQYEEQKQEKAKRFKDLERSTGALQLSLTDARKQAMGLTADLETERTLKDQVMVDASTLKALNQSLERKMESLRQTTKQAATELNEQLARKTGEVESLQHKLQAVDQRRTSAEHAAASAIEAQKTAEEVQAYFFFWGGGFFPCFYTCLYVLCVQR